MNDDIISTFKHYIKNDATDRFYELFEVITTTRKYKVGLDYQLVFKDVYLCCCIHRKKELIEFLYEVYKTFHVVDRIALRPCIIYGKYLYKEGYPIQLPKDPKDY